MAQEGNKLLMSLVDSGKSGFAEFLDYQLAPDMFKGEEAELYEFVSEFAMKYAKLPTRKTTRKWADKVGVSLSAEDAIVEPADYYYDGLEHRNLRLNLLRAMQAAEETRQDSPKESLATLTSSIIDLNSVHKRKQLVNISEDGGKIVQAEFKKAVLGGEENGLNFGWETFDKMSGGLGGGDVVSIVGRPGMGKTYLALHSMIHAWHAGKTTLFVSMEMKCTPIVQRVVAMSTNTSIGELKSGMVASKKYKNLHSILGAMNGEHGMWVADGALSATTDDLIMLCNQINPDLLIIDGMYLLQHHNSRLSRHDRINTNAEVIKGQIAEAMNMPVTQTLQLNREAAKKLKQKGPDEVDLEDIAGSDSIGQLSSCVLGLFQGENIETMLRRKVRIMKGRNGEMGEFMINWRFGGFGAPQDGEQTKKDGISPHPDNLIDTSNIMNFSEIPPDLPISQMQYY